MHRLPEHTSSAPGGVAAERRRVVSNRGAAGRIRGAVRLSGTGMPVVSASAASSASSASSAITVHPEKVASTSYATPPGAGERWAAAGLEGEHEREVERLHAHADRASKQRVIFIRTRRDCGLRRPILGNGVSSCG